MRERKSEREQEIKKKIEKRERESGSGSEKFREENLESREGRKTKIKDC